MSYVVLMLSLLCVYVLMFYEKLYLSQEGCLLHFCVPVFHPISLFQLNCNVNTAHHFCPAGVVCVDQRRRSTDVLPVLPILAGEIIEQVI